VQDAAAALPALLLGDVAGADMLDLCAAPGGKTMQLAAAGARVTALDSDPDRLGRLRDNLARTGLSATLACADATQWAPGRTYDAVLLDAPCTATGTLRRHPDIAWLRRPTDIAKLAALQTRLLDAAQRLTRPGGVCVYAVCSLEPEEGPAVVAAALDSGAWARDARAGAALPPAFVTANGDLRTTPGDWPEQGGLDGFYAAALRRL
jgi:16S rRNA (cytosine967-C5)-methyltransferase